MYYYCSNAQRFQDTIRKLGASLFNHKDPTIIGDNNII